MLFTNSKGKLVAAVSVLTLLAACSSSPKKPAETTQQSPTDNSQATTPLAPGQTAQAFNPDTVATTQYTMEAFGPNPYVTNAPYVSDIDKKAMADALLLIEEEKLEDAEEALTQLVDSLPRYSGPAYNLARLKLRQEDMEGAKKYATLAVDRNYYNLNARNLQGFIYREMGDFAAAEAAYKEALGVWGGYAPAYRNLGILYDLYMGNPEKALGYYKQYNALQKAPDKQVTGWTVDIERRLAAQRKREAAERQAQQAAAQEQAAADQEAEAAPANAEATQTADASAATNNPEGVK